MAEISRITLPNGSNYDIKDATARSTISTIINSMSGGIHYRGVTTTALTDGATTSPIKINNADYAPQTGDIVIYGQLEFIYAVTGDTSSWHEFGSTGSLKALAFQDKATADYTPQGIVSAPTFSGKAKSVSVKGTFESTAALHWASENIVTGNSSIPTPQPGKPQNTVTPTAKATGADVSLKTASINAVGSVGTLPAWNASVNGETLSFSWNTGSLPTISAKTVATGVSSVTQPTITCGKLFATASVNAEITSTGSYTPEGTNSAPEFTGTGETIVVS